MLVVVMHAAIDFSYLHYNNSLSYKYNKMNEWISGLLENEKTAKNIKASVTVRASPDSFLVLCARRTRRMYKTSFKFYPYDTGVLSDQPKLTLDIFAVFQPSTTQTSLQQQQQQHHGNQLS